METEEKLSKEVRDLLESIQQMNSGDTGRVYTPEQILAIAARRSSNLTQTEFAKLLDVSVDAIRDWEQGRRSPRGAARTLLTAHDVDGQRGFLSPPARDEGDLRRGRAYDDPVLALSGAAPAHPLPRGEITTAPPAPCAATK